MHLIDRAERNEFCDAQLKNCHEKYQTHLFRYFLSFWPWFSLNLKNKVGAAGIRNFHLQTSEISLFEY